MQIQNLKVYCDLVETGSFSLAAERSGITQSAVSQQIKSMEEKFGVVFFERGRKNFSITPEGQVFFQSAQRMLDIWLNIESELKAVRNEVGGKIRLSTVFSLGLHELPPLIKQFRAAFPQVEVAPTYRRAGEVYQDVAEDRADLGLVAYPKPRRGLLVETFAEDRMVLICPPGHPLAGRGRVPLPELASCRFISFEPDVPTRKAIDQLLRDRNVEVTVSMELDNIETVKRAVEVDSGIAIVPANSVVEEVASGQLCSLEIADAEMWRPTGMVLRRGRTITPALREFVEVLREFGRRTSHGRGPVAQPEGPEEDAAAAI